jgi:hypothetical protein
LGIKIIKVINKRNWEAIHGFVLPGGGRSVTPFEELGDNAAVSENQWGTDKELIKELWRYLQFLHPDPVSDESYALDRPPANRRVKFMAMDK